MPKLRALSGKEVLGIFLSFEFEVAFQRGSHVKLRRITADGHRQTLTIPNHAEMDKGTLRAIFNQASKYISESELMSHFYNK